VFPSFFCRHSLTENRLLWWCTSPAIGSLAKVRRGYRPNAVGELRFVRSVAPTCARCADSFARSGLTVIEHERNSFARSGVSVMSRDNGLRAAPCDRDRRIQGRCGAHDQLAGHGASPVHRWSQGGPRPPTSDQLSQLPVARETRQKRTRFRFETGLRSLCADRHCDSRFRGSDQGDLARNYGNNGRPSVASAPVGDQECRRFWACLGGPLNCSD